MKKYILLLSSLLPTILFAQITGQVKLDVNDIQFSKQDRYDRIIYGNGYSQNVGAPELPVVMQSWVIPVNAEFKNITVTETNRTKMKGAYKVYPVQAPVPTNFVSLPSFTEPDSTIYNRTTSYPEQRVRLIRDDLTMGYHIVTVEISPLEYLPKQQELYLSELTYAINYTVAATNRTSAMPKQSKLRYELTKEHIASMVENPSDMDKYAPNYQIIGESLDMNRYSSNASKPSKLSRGISVLEELQPDYIIVTNETLKPVFQRLADWKTQKGLPTIIVTVEDIYQNYTGCDKPEKIRNYLLKAKEKWGEGLFVLLGGDTNIVPTKIVKGDNSVLRPGDLYYNSQIITWNPITNTLSDDRKQDFMFYIGRAPVENPIEANVFIDKVLKYEKLSANIDYSYFNNYLAADGFISKDESTGQLYSGAMFNIDTIFKNTIGENIQRWYQFDHFGCTKTDHKVDNGKIYRTDRGEELNYHNFMSALNTGGNSGLNHFHFVYHMDHSSPRNLGTSSKDKNESILCADADNLTNGDYLQIMMSGGCEPADFSKDCIAERLLNNPNGGVVAFIGNSDQGWPSEWSEFSFSMNALFKNTSKKLFYNIAIPFQNSYDGNKGTYWRYHLLGDPEMPIWTAVPQDLNVSITTSQKTENSTTVNTITVQINNLPAGQEALACLMKGTEYYTTYTIADTQPHSFSYIPSTSGEVKVTVTAHNYRPFETTVPIDAGSYPHITMEPTIRDSGSNCNGNGDGQLDAGETIELTATLHSAVERNLTNALFELVPSSTDIKMLDSIVSFNSITLSPSTAQTAKFRFKINKGCKEKLKNELNAVRFELYMQSNNNTRKYQDSIKVDIFAPDIKVGNQRIASTSNGNLTVEANEIVDFYVDIRNIGKAEAVDVVGRIYPNSPYVNECAMVPISFPNIPKYETVNNGMAFQFSTTSGYVPGTPLSLNLEVRNRYGKAWTFTIDPVTRPATIAQSDISFEGYENYINLLWTANSPYYNIFRSDSETGEYVKLNEFPLTNEYFRDDNVSLNSIYYYKIVAINKSGNESAPSNPVKAWTTLPLLEGFPVTMSDQSPDDFWTRSGVTTYDINNDGKQEIFAVQVKWNPNKARIVGLDSNGEDLFDIDGNVTTKSGFVLWNNDIRAVPTLADLKSDGEVKVIVASREGTPNYIRCYSTKDADNDHLPDLLWEKPTTASYLRSAIIANMDNSSDGSQEIVLMSCEGKGNIIILDYNGNQLYNFGNNLNTYSAPAIADLDGDNDMEIIVGNYDGIYIWHHDGTPFSTNPIYTETGYYLSSSPVICDIDNDGQKEILMTAKKNIENNEIAAECIVLALNLDGTLVQGWNKTQKSSCSHYMYSYDIAVGDLNGDGKLEIVALGVNKLKVWNNKGEILLEKNIDARYNSNMIPILADVDGDSLSEIIFGNEQGVIPTIYAINLDGTEVAGFPLAPDSMIYGTVCVTDIDNDGKNEIVLMTDKIIYVWKTEGKSNCIEWGAARHDHLNTGEYGKTCLPEVIASNTVWNGESPCGSIFIQSGNFTVPSGTTLNLNSTSEIVVRSGGTLTIDGATINNAYIRALSGSHVVLKNGGTINLRNASDFIIDLGATLDYQSGAIMPD